MKKVTRVYQGKDGKPIVAEWSDDRTKGDFLLFALLWVLGTPGCWGIFACILLIALAIAYA